MKTLVSGETRLWRSLWVFNLYRLVQMPLLALMVYLSVDTVMRRSFDARETIILIGCVHTFLIAVGCAFSRFRERHLGFNAQLGLQVAADALCVALLMFCVDGIQSGFGGVILITVAGASLMSSSRFAFFYAATATVVLLLMTFAYDFAQPFSASYSTYFQDLAYLAFPGLTFFVVAYVAHLFGRRLSINEELAWRRGAALDEQMRISRGVMERMRDGVLVVNADGRVVDYNPMALSILIDRNPMTLAVLGKEEPLAPPLLEQVDTDLACGYWAWREGGEAEVEVQRPDGPDIVASFERTHGAAEVVLIFLRDMSRLREQAMQFKLAALGRLTASIAHEIRNPLSSIRHASELLAEEIQHPAQSRLLSIVSGNIRRLDRIVQDVLMLGRQNVTDQEDIGLAAFFREFIPEVEAQENLPAGMIVSRIPEEARMPFNPEQLRQVLWNLLGNALRYASRNTGAVRLEATIVGKAAELHIIDDGTGIPNELQAQIFEPFFTTSSKGTGLGLHIARELCGNNGATLFLAPGKTGGHFVLKGKESR